MSAVTNYLGANDASMERSVEKNNAYLSKIVGDLLERRGRFQIIIIMLLCLNSIIVGINHTITTFYTYRSKFYCRDNASSTCDYYVNGTECPGGYEFYDVDDHTLAIEFRMVCGRELLNAMINSLYFMGVMLGSLICSSLCDIYGRRKLVLICIYGQTLMAIGQYYASNLIVFSALRMVQGFFIQGLQTCSYTLMLEYCQLRYRTMVAIFWELNWAFGLGILGAASYFIRDWRLLTLAMTTPAILSIAYTWCIPESIVWLKTKGRYQQVLVLFQRIAKFNGHQDLLEESTGLELAVCEQSHKKATNTTKSNDVTFAAIVRSAVLRKHTLSMICIWFSVTLTYFSILNSLPTLAGNRHLNFEIGAVVEIAAYVLAYFTLSSFGRRIPMAFYQYANSVLIVVITILTVLPENPLHDVLLIVTTQAAKGLAVSGFGTMFIYCSELLPTVCRGLGLGVCGFSARCGALVAALLIALAEYVPNFVPLCILSVVLLITGTITLRLPDTLTTVLPNTIGEADRLWASRK